MPLVEIIGRLALNLSLCFQASYAVEAFRCVWVDQ